MEKRWRKLHLIKRFFDGSKFYFIFAVAASLAATVLGALTPQVFRFAIDSVLKENKYPWISDHMWILAAVLIILAFLTGAAQFIFRFFSSKAGESFAKKLRDTLYMHIQKLQASWHDRHQTGDIVQRCTSDVEVIRDFVVTQLLEVFRTTFLIVVSFAMMMSMNKKLSLIVLFFVPVIIAYSTIFYKLIAKGFIAADEAEGELSTVVQENATGVRVVRAFGREKFEMDRFQEKNNVFAKLWIRLGTLSGLYWGVGDLITGMQVITVITLGAVEAVRGNLMVGEFIAFASYNMTLVWPVRGLGRILTQMSKAGVSFERVEYILKGEEEPVQDGDLQVTTEAPSIEFSHVRFSYEEGKEILQDISFTVHKGETIGILGGTGSGKSTLMMLLARFYELPEGNGQIRMDGTDIRKIPLPTLRKRVGIVLQEPFLYSRTIRDNMKLGNKEATEEEVRKAAQIACVDHAICEFADGYDTLVGERGVTLSGGQRQRVAIARMLLEKTPVMVFDDSLSAVDSKTDTQIRKALKQEMNEATVFIISHRITTLMGADRIVVLNQGKIEAIGTHSELIGREGSYRRIYDIQMSRDDRMKMGVI